MSLADDTQLRQQAIRSIEQLFPADSPHLILRETGRRLLQLAQMERTEWRYEPTGVLMRYAELCAEEQARQERQAERNAENGI